MGPQATQLTLKLNKRPKRLNPASSIHHWEARISGLNGGRIRDGERGIGDRGFSLYATVRAALMDYEPVVSAIESRKKRVAEIVLECRVARLRVSVVLQSLNLRVCVSDYRHGLQRERLTRQTISCIRD
jgi:hypothetical protein